jgi:hypothetical protein
MTRTRNPVWLSLPLALLLGCAEQPAPTDPQAPVVAPIEPVRPAEPVQVAGERYALPTAEQQLAVTNLLGLYSQFGDEADRAGYRRVFAAEAHIEIDGTTRSVEQHTDQHIARSAGLRQAGLQPRRLFSSPVLSVAGPDELRVRGYFTDVVSRPARVEEPWVIAVGRFQATVQRARDEEWRIHDWREWPDQVIDLAVPVAEPEVPVAVEPGEIPIDRRQWRLRELHGEQLAAGLPVPTLALDGAAGRASGFAGVHPFEGRIRLGEETLRFSAVLARGAEEPEAAVALQEAYLGMLSRVRAWQFDERTARLVLLDEQSEPLAMFAAAD